VVSTISMHHWADPAAGLREIVRVLRPGARAWIYDFRTMTRRAGRMTSGLDAKVGVENPITRTWRLNPVGRLVLTLEE
jgi:ubiquinone/menaquinone biosynthesis C-methylase UbiE